MSVSTARLRGNAASDANLRLLAKHYPSLYGMLISDCELTQDMVEQLRRFPALKTMLLMDCGVTDEQLQRISRMDVHDQLSTIWVAGSSFSERGVAQLCQISALSRITVWSNDLSQEEIRRYCTRTDVEIQVLPLTDDE